MLAILASQGHPMSTLKQAIEKALDGGWTVFGDLPEITSWAIEQDTLAYYDSTGIKFVRFEEIIFNHKFAKGLAGTKRVCIECGKPYDFEKLACTSCLCGAYNEAWEVFLTSIAIAPDRLKYLKEYLDEVS